jgi:hypothetical protein
MLHGKKPGDVIKLVLTRDGKDFDIFWKLPAAKKKHIFEVLQSPTSEQLSLRETWMQNLP